MQGFCLHRQRAARQLDIQPNSCLYQKNEYSLADRTSLEILETVQSSENAASPPVDASFDPCYRTN